MTKLTTEHPAVEAAMMEMTKGSGPLVRTAFNSQALNEALKVLEAALPHLTTATEENLARLRDTPVGRALMAEGWEEGMLDHMGQRRGAMSPEVVNIVRERIADANPYREDS